MVRLRVKALLKQRGWTIYRLTQELRRVPYTVVYRVANGRVRRLDLRLAEKLCAVLNCEPGELLERVPERRRRKPISRRRKA